MFKNTFLKTLYEKRWTMIAWGVSFVFLVVLTILFFPTLKESFGASLKDIPDSLKSLIGDAAAYQTLPGFLDIQVFNQMDFMTLIMGVIVFTGLLAGAESDGTLQTVLTLPISRGKFYIDRFLAGAAIIASACVAILIGILLGALFVKESVAFGPLVLACGMLWLITLVFSSFGYMLGAVTGKRGMAGAVTGGIAFVSYLITALAPSVPALKVPNQLSPFHYFNNPSILRVGMDWSDAAILASIVIVLFVIGFWGFRKRDIYQA